MTSTAASDNSLQTGQTKNLVLALLGFTITFWAWNIIAPLGVRYSGELALSPTQASLLVAMPVLVGSLGRVPVGALTDRYGGRVMFTVLTLASAVPVLLVGFAGSLGSYALLLVFGFFLGVAGTTFAVGIPFVNAWFEPARRGFATGVFGAGMGGTALSAFFTPRLVRSIGYVPTHILIAGALVVVGAVLWLLMRDSPAWKPNLAPVVPKLTAAAKLAAHLADVLPLRRRLRWFCGVLYVPADIHQECLRLRLDRCWHQNRRFCYRGRARSTTRRHPG